MKVSASVFSNPSVPLQQVVQSLDVCKVDMLHVDCSDEPEVFEKIEEIRTYSKTPIDLHIISDRPSLFVPLIEKHKPEFVQFQYESLPSNFEHPIFEHSKMGLSIVSETDWKVFSKFEKAFRHILFMATTPGKSGGRFDPVNFKKIRSFKKQFPATRVHVDGGVNGEVSFILRTLGVDCIISGSFLVKNDNPALAMLDLLHREIDSSFQVYDFMLPLEELPVMNINEANFFAAVETIDRYKYGFMFFTDNSGKLVGMTTNADLRKALLKNQQNLANIPVTDFINPHPFTCDETLNVGAMLSKVKSASFPVLYLPVINSNGNLTGALTFQQLIKGE